MLLIVNHALSSFIAKSSRKGAIAGISVTLVLGGVAAYGTTPGTLTYEGRFRDVREELAVTALQRVEAELPLHTREVRIQSGDTVQAMLARIGVSNQDIVSSIRSNTQSAALFRQIAPGKTLTALVTTDGELNSLAFPLNGAKDTLLLIQREENGYRAEQREMELETRTTIQSSVIRFSLFGAADDAGVPETVAMQLTDIFGGDIDFHRDLRKGDRFTVVYDTVTYQGKVIRPQRILAAEFVNDGKTYQAFWHQPIEGSGGYFSKDGKNIRKAFLRSPLEFSRITSGFTNARYHPVLQEMRAHRGVDYGAPTGTRVKATGDGIVEFSGIQGGYGKVISVRHGGNKTTVYGHLSGFAQGMRSGARVAQGDIIGYVGSTGLATGPHLHYEFKVAGVHQNPLSVVLPNATPLAPHELKSFQAAAQGMSEQIELARGMQLVRLD